MISLIGCSASGDRVGVTVGTFAVFFRVCSEYKICEEIVFIAITNVEQLKKFFLLKKSLLYYSELETHFKN